MYTRSDSFSAHSFAGVYEDFLHTNIHGLLSLSARLVRASARTEQREREKDLHNHRESSLRPSRRATRFLKNFRSSPE